MRCNIIGCGESGALWDGTGDSIGVNDCAKFGHDPGGLVLLDHPSRFTPDRLKTIVETKPQRVFSHITNWRRTFLNSFTMINYKFWTQQHANQFKIEDKLIFVSNTSPFCAISIAVNLGFREIVLYGVDFKTHATWNASNTNFAQEKQQYQSFIKALAKSGVSVFSAAPSALDLPQPGGEVEGLMETTFIKTTHE